MLLCGHEIINDIYSQLAKYVASNLVKLNLPELCAVYKLPVYAKFQDSQKVHK